MGKRSCELSRRVRRSLATGGRMRKLTKEQRRDVRVIAGKRDEEIDFSDAPRVLDWSKAEIGKFYRPKKKPVTMRLDADVIEWLKEDGPGYQTKANWLLRQAMKHFAGERGVNSGGRLQRVGRGKERSRDWFRHARLGTRPEFATIHLNGSTCM